MRDGKIKSPYSGIILYYKIVFKFHFEWSEEWTFVDKFCYDVWLELTIHESYDGGKLFIERSEHEFFSRVPLLVNPSLYSKEYEVIVFARKLNWTEVDL